MKFYYKLSPFFFCCCLLAMMNLSLAQGSKTVFNGALRYDSHQSIQEKNLYNSNKRYNKFKSFFKKFQVYDIPSGEIHSVLNQSLSQGKQADINLHLGVDRNWDLTLFRFDVLAKNYVHSESVNGQMKISEKPRNFTYKGYVNGKKTNRVVLTIKDSFVNGFVMIDGIKYNVESLRHFDLESDEHDVVVFESESAIEPEGATCEGGHHKDEFLGGVKKHTSHRGSRVQAAGTCIELAVAYDPEFNDKFGGNGADEIIARSALLSDWYTNEWNFDIDFKLVETHLEVNEEISPANKTTVCTGGNDLVDDMDNWGPTGFVNQHDIGAYWLARNICGSGCGVVGCATVSGVCSQSRYNVNEDFFSTTERNTIIWAHEIGHNLGANHSSGDNLMSASLSGQQGANFGIAPATRSAIVNSRDNASCLSNACRDEPPLPKFKFNANFCDLTVAFEDASTNVPTSWSWDFDGNGSTDATTENPLFSFPSEGKYAVKLTVSNAFGSSDTTVSITVQGPRPSAPQVSVLGDEDCGTITVNLSAIGTAPFNWYSDPTGGELLNTGASYNPTISATTSYYVTSGNVTELNGGAKTPSTQGGYFDANDLRGLIFNVNENAILRSALVDSDVAGTRKIELLDGVDGNVLASRDIEIEQGRQRIDLGFELSPGSGYFLKVTGSLVSLFRDNGGVNYPINIGNAVTLTGTNASVPGFYYFFYDWIIDVGCASERTEATAMVEVCSSLDEGLTSASSLQLYPVPTNSVITIESKDLAQNEVSFEVRTTLGQVVYEESLRTASGVQHTIDLSDYPKGIYFLTTSVGSSKITKKVILE